MAINYVGFSDYYASSVAIATENKVISALINNSDNPITINKISCIVPPPIIFSQANYKFTLTKLINQSRTKPKFNGSINATSALNRIPNNVIFGCMGQDVFSLDRTILRTGFITMSGAFNFNPSSGYAKIKPEYAIIYSNENTQIQSIVLRNGEGILLTGDFTNVSCIHTYIDFTI